MPTDSSARTGPIDTHTLRVLFTVTIFIGGLALLYAGRRTLLIFLFALLFAYVLEPIIERVHVILGGGRLRALIIVYCIGVVSVGALAAVAAPGVIQESRRLAGAFPTLLDQVGSGRIARQLGQQHGWSYSTQEALEGWLANHRQNVLDVEKTIETHAAGVGASLGWLALIPILAFFFLKDRKSIGDALLSLVQDGERRVLLCQIYDDMDHMLTHFIRAQLLLAGCAMVAYTAFLLIVRFPYGWALGVVGGVLEFIPVVGWVATAIVLLGIALLTGYSHWAVLLAFIGLWRLTQDYVNMPHLMGRGLKLHPLAAIFGVLVGAEIAGIPGVFLSIPVIATLRIIWNRWQMRQLTTDIPLREPADRRRLTWIEGMTPTAKTGTAER